MKLILDINLQLVVHLTNPHMLLLPGKNEYERQNNADSVTYEEDSVDDLRNGAPL